WGKQFTTGSLPEGAKLVGGVTTCKGRAYERETDEDRGGTRGTLLCGERHAAWHRYWFDSRGIRAASGCKDWRRRAFRHRGSDIGAYSTTVRRTWCAFDHAGRNAGTRSDHRWRRRN